MNSKEDHDAVSKDYQKFLDQIKTDVQNIVFKTELIFIKDDTSEATSSPTSVDFIFSTPQELSDFMILLLVEALIRDMNVIRKSLDDN